MIDQNLHKALSVFLHDLFAALHAQAANGTDDDGDQDGGAVSNGYQRGSRGTEGVTARLQDLIQQLASPNSTAANGSTDSPTSVLQQDFSNLLSALGNFGNAGHKASLGDFLKAIADNLQGGNPGLLVSSQV